LRIIYIIYDKNGYSNSKIIHFFKIKYFQLFKLPQNLLNKKLLEKVFLDFFDVNFKILHKKVDLIDYYQFVYSLLINEDHNGCAYLPPNYHIDFSEIFLEGFEKLFKYEMSIPKNQLIETSYVKLLHSLFNMFYLDNSIQHKKQKAIEIICRVVRNCANNMKITILEEISFSHISFFSEDSNVLLLENLLDSIKENILSPGIYDYFIKYLDILFIHTQKGNYSVIEFQSIIRFLSEKINNFKIFCLALSYCKKYLLHIQENDVINNLSQMTDKMREVNGFLMILAKSSYDISEKQITRETLQDILNVYSTFLIIKVINFYDIDFSSKFKFQKDNEVTDFTIYFLVFAENIPVLIFNKNTFLTSPIKIEINYQILNSLGENKKLLANEFDDFGDGTKKWIRDLDIISQIYLLGIYISFIAKFLILKIMLGNDNEQKDILKGKLEPEKILTTKASIINLLEYLTDNSFLYDKEMNELFIRLFDRYTSKYLDILKTYHNTQYKQKLLSSDLMMLLNYSCFYHEKVRNKALDLIKVYANYFPFLLNEYDIFEYYVNVLGILISHSLRPFEFFIKRINIDDKYVLELPSETVDKEIIYNKLSQIFERCLQKSHIINNNNIAYNIANYVNKYTLSVNLEHVDMNYSINILQKIYNNIKKIEIPSFLKTTAYLDPKKFEDYLNDNVYKNFDKYISISAIDDLYNFTDYAKSTILQIRNKFMGIIEGKINNLRVSYSKDILYEKYKKMFCTGGDEEKAINDYCYFMIINDINIKMQKTFNESTDNNVNIFPLLVELTSLMIYSGMNNFKTNFNNNVIRDEIINLITSIPVYLASTSSIEAGVFCWEWILYFKKDMIPSLLNNIILSIKSLKQYICLKKSSFFNSSGTGSKSEIFDVEDHLRENKFQALVSFENDTLISLKNSLGIYKKPKQERYLINIINEKLLKNLDLNDYINSQIILMKFIKECMHEFCKCDIEKLTLIYDIVKQFIDLKIDEELYLQPLYIYLHFFIFNISIELLEIFHEKRNLFSFSNQEIYEFKILLYLFGFKYFEFNKQRRMVENKVLLSEIEQTLINCVEMIIKDKNRKESLGGKLEKIKTNKRMKRVYTFVYSIEMKLKELEHNPFMIIDNIKDLLVYLIESEINNLRYWNSPSTFHSQNKKYTPSSSKLKEERVKNIFETAFSISNKLSIKLVQRYPWIERKFTSYINDLCSIIYNNKKTFYHQPLALKYLIDHIARNNLPDLNDFRMMKHLLLWKFPSLNVALKYIYIDYNNKFGLHRYCTFMLEKAKNSAIIFYMPQLIQSTRTSTHYQVEKYIIKKCKQSNRIAHQFLWSLEVENITGPHAKMRFLPRDHRETVHIRAKIMRDKILKNLNPMERRFWYDESTTFANITEISSRFLHPDDFKGFDTKLSKEKKTELVRRELGKLTRKFANYIYLPTNPDTKILEIIPDSAFSLQSAKKVPFIVSFIGQVYKGPDFDYIVSGMNLSEFIHWEIMNFEANIRNGLTQNNLSQNLFDLNTIISNSKACKSTNLSYFKDNENSIRLQMIREESSVDQAQVLLDEDPFILNEQDEYQDLNIPFMDIKRGIFTKKDSYHEEDNIFQTDHLRSTVYEVKDVLNINDLSNCTDEAIEEDLNYRETMKGKTRTHGGNNNYDCGVRTEEINKKINISCIFKSGDDLRQDSLALQVIHIFQEIFKENGLKLFVYPYQTISTISSFHKDLGGFIECCQDCDSRDQIGKTYDTNLYDYFICCFGHENSNEFRRARKNFIESLAAYAIISYILQIKDRHNGNILIDKWGHIIHIDFGFIFDISPANNMRFEKAAFKLTKEMLKIMGSPNSESYETFVDLTIRGFLACRDYMDKLLDPVVLMFNSGLECFRADSIKNFIDRFKLELTEDEAAIYMKGLIRQSEDNWRTNFYDYLQKKQNNISY
jgi:hypothetical protein